MFKLLGLLALAIIVLFRDRYPRACLGCLVAIFFLWALDMSVNYSNHVMAAVLAVFGLGLAGLMCLNGKI